MRNPSTIESWRDSLLWALFFLMGLSIFTLLPPPAHAQWVSGSPHIGLEPADSAHSPYFVFSGHPGGHLTGQIRVVNSGTATAAVNLYPVDATTGQTSGTVYQDKTVPLRDTGAWLTLAYPHLTISPQQSIIVPFAVRVPRTVQPGVHVGGIVAELQTPPHYTAPSPTSNVQIITRSLNIVAVEVRISGPLRENLAVSNIHLAATQGYQLLLVTLHNTGNTLLKPEGMMLVQDSRGAVRQKLKLRLGTFLPNTSIDYPVYIQQRALEPGAYQASLTLSYGAHYTLRYAAPISVTEQQLRQSFSTSSSPLQPPPLPAGSPSWLIWLSAGLVVFSVIYWIYRMAKSFIIAQVGQRREKTLQRKR